jgi:hypothetical protein
MQIEQIEKEVDEAVDSITKKKMKRKNSWTGDEGDGEEK